MTTKKILTSFSCDPNLLEWIEERARTNQVSKSEQIHNLLVLAKSILTKEENKDDGIATK